MTAGEQREREQVVESEAAAKAVAAKVRGEQRYGKPPRDERREAAQKLARERWAEWARKKAE